LTDRRGVRRARVAVTHQRRADTVKVDRAIAVIVEAVAGLGRRGAGDGVAARAAAAVALHGAGALALAEARRAAGADAVVFVGVAVAVVVLSVALLGDRGDLADAGIDHHPRLVPESGEQGDKPVFAYMGDTPSEAKQKKKAEKRNSPTPFARASWNIDGSCDS
jgi:hypothetical protein